ncbi:hypothetical protein [Streptomyces sp. NRRL WC-3742]|uniref:hypothetical protein n=1 Tax=Streptomyces sp. NRRL WC-3742 TaxID=1463934 RepID=UPI0004CC4BBA|nr:hypothetical protein [Streptomyces sp. NRRL WC-3742]
MSLRGKIRKLAVVVAVAGAVVSVPTTAMAGGFAPHQSSGQSLESGSAGVGLFGPHANWFNFAEHSESDCGC